MYDKNQADFYKQTDSCVSCKSSVPLIPNREYKSSTPYKAIPPPMVQQPLLGQGLLFIKDSRSHSDTPHSIVLLWTRDQPDAENTQQS